MFRNLVSAILNGYKFFTMRRSMLLCMLASLIGSSYAQNSPGIPVISASAATDSVTIQNPFFNNDLTDLFKTDIAELPIGFIGNKFQRFQIIFTEIKKSDTSSSTYIIKGKNKVKSNVCDFTGTANITNVTFSNPPTVTGYPKAGNIGTLTGTYLFKEDTTQKHVGTLQGNFMIRFYQSTDKKITIDDWTINSDSTYSNNQYIGTWKSYDGKTTQTCNFGTLRIPESGDLDVGRKEFQPNDKYKDNGWQTYGSLLNTDWWKIK